MKEHSLVAGGRRWFGTDFVELQSEALRAAQGIVADCPPCVLSGCRIVVAGANMSITPGFVAMEAAGQVRIAFFEGTAPQSTASHPRYMYIQATDASRLYDDGVSRKVTTNYKAVLQEGIVLGAASIFFADSGAPRFVDSLGALGVGAVTAYNYSGSYGITAALSFRINSLARRVDVWGTVGTSNAQGLSLPPYFYGIANMPLAVPRPLVNVHIPLSIRFHNSDGLSGAELRAMPLELKADGGVAVGLIRPVDPGVSSYTGIVSGSYPI